MCLCLSLIWYAAGWNKLYVRVWILITQKNTNSVNNYGYVPLICVNKFLRSYRKELHIETFSYNWKQRIDSSCSLVSLDCFSTLPFGYLSPSVWASDSQRSYVLSFIEALANAAIPLTRTKDATRRPLCPPSSRGSQSTSAPARRNRTLLLEYVDANIEVRQRWLPTPM